METEEFRLGQTVYFGRRIENQKGKRRQGPGIIIARYRDAYALVHFRGSYLGISLDDTKSAGKILEALGCDGALQLHLANTKFPLRYLVGSQNVNFLSKEK